MRRALLFLSSLILLLAGVMAAGIPAASAASGGAHAMTARLDAADGNSYSSGSGETAEHEWETYVAASGEGATTYSFQAFINSSVGCNGNVSIDFSYSYNTQALHPGEYLAIDATATLSDGRSLFLGDYKVTDHTAWPGKPLYGIFKNFFDASSPVPHVTELEVHTFISDGTVDGVPEHSASATVSDNSHACKTVPVRTDAEPITLPSGASNGSFENAFQANIGDMWTSEPTGTGGDWQAGMAPGTSPSIAAVSGGYEVALQTNTNDLWLLGSAGDIDTGLGMMPGTSPSITPLFNGGYEVAFQANTGELWTAGSAGDVNWTLGMAPFTSPSITVLGTDGYEVAFNAAGTNDMWTAGTAGPDQDWGAGMDPASSPSITVAAGGYEVAFQTNTHDLWTLGTDGYNDWDLGMMPGTSPAIGTVSSGGAGYEIAFQANDGNLWNAGADGTGGDVFGMSAGTSPAITSV
jgi:hypothetical protein